MSVTNFIQKLSFASRSNDWRVSFVPFIIGCVYLWLYIFKISFKIESLQLVALSLMTTFGFASLGYIINEFFDQNTDRLAGKINKLSLLTLQEKTVLISVSLLLTFSPWIWLPSDGISWLFIVLQVSFFLLYSLPFPRFKSIPVLSGFIDASYAYVIPLLLSFHTYRLYAGASLSSFIFLFSLSVFFIGYRNILIHQVNDIFKDRLSGIITLPQLAGPIRTNQLIVLLLICEIFSTLFFSALIVLSNPFFLVWIFFYSMFIITRYMLFNYKIRSKYVAIQPVRHLTDLAYQIGFPAINLLLIICFDWRWIVLLPFHFLLFIPRFFTDKIVEFLVYIQSALASKLVYPIRLFFSRTINYIIYYAFRAFGINLIKEKKSAYSFLKSLFKK